MTIEDAITNHLWESLASSGRVAEDHRQQADWLRELVEVREELARLRNAMWDRANARAIDHMTEDELRGLCAGLYETIDELRELCKDLYALLLNAYDPKEIDDYYDRMQRLVIEVDE